MSESGSPAIRLPDFIIIGAMKAGTTTLFRWLDEQPEVRMGAMKEPHFFSDERVWARGVQWYSSLFAAAGADELTGEASVSYSRRRTSAAAAERIVSTVGGVKLVYVVRDPVERLRSHYRHAVQRGRERRPLRQAVLEPENVYVEDSLYFACLLPYVERFPRSQMCVVRFEDLVAGDGGAWTDILRHIGLERRPRPDVAHNVTAARPVYRPLMKLIWDSRWARRLLDVPLPRQVRALGRRALVHDGPVERIMAADEALPQAVLDRMAEDAGRLADWLGRRQPLWPVGR